MQYKYLDMTINLPEADVVNTRYFSYCAKHDFHLQACVHCNLLHYPPSEGCPWCGSPDQEWRPVAGRGHVYSYHEVVQAIQPGFKPHTPYLVLLVQLDAQSGKPTEHEALRVFGNLVMADGSLATPDEVKKVGIGSRVRMVFTDLAEGFSIPQWTLDLEQEQPRPWRYLE